MYALWRQRFDKGDRPTCAACGQPAAWFAPVWSLTWNTSRVVEVALQAVSYYCQAHRPEAPDVYRLPPWFEIQ